MTATYDDAVLAWAAELREGSKRTWAEFLDDPGDERLELDPLPTAAQLEVVRRLPADVPDRERLADLVLATPAAWRGAIDVPLPWHEPPAFGAPPVEPELLHPDELLRVVASAITGLLVEEPAAAPAHRPRAGGLFRKRFALLGAPSTGRVLAEALTARGLREGGPKPTYFVLGGPLEDLMQQRWAARIRGGSTIRWRPFWRYARNHDRIPPGIQSAALAERLAREVGGARVHLVLASTAQEALDTAAGILRVQSGPVTEPAEVFATDLLRVVNGPLTLAAGEQERARLVGQVWPALTEGAQTEPLGAPRPHLEWAVAAAERQVEHIVRGARSAGYAVHGDPAVVVPDPGSAVPRSVRRHDTLALGLDVLGRAWERHLQRERAE